MHHRDTAEANAIPVRKRADPRIYAAFSNHGGESSIIKIGFKTDWERRFEHGTREIFHHEPDRPSPAVNMLPTDVLEQAVLEFVGKLGLRVRRDASPSPSPETVRSDPASLARIQAAMPSGNRAVDRFLVRVIQHLGPIGHPDARPTIAPGRIQRHQAVSRPEGFPDARNPPVDWGLHDAAADEDVPHRPASRGARRRD